jgi:hypothetical protein
VVNWPILFALALQVASTMSGPMAKRNGQEKRLGKKEKERQYHHL